jgi:hypothetical protein
VASISAVAGKGLVRVAWRGVAGGVSLELVRKPGLRGAASTVLYRGSGAAFLDKKVGNGRDYRYELRVADAAGNVTAKAVKATPRRPLYRPAFGEIVRGPPTLAWDGNGARFYTVQVVRDGVMVLSAWPRATTLRLRSTWRYAGKEYRLEPGRYRWYVWGAQGTRERPKYGRPLGTSFFDVK